MDIHTRMITINNFFPTSIGSILDKEFALNLLPIVKNILSNKNLLSNTWGYKNTYTKDKGLETHKELESFRDYIIEIGHTYLKNIGYDSSGLDFNTQIFASEMFEGDYHPRHSHPNSFLSGVFYLDVPDGSSPLLFYDPRPFRDFVELPRISHDISLSWDRVFYQPENGLLLIWESWLSHEVIKNTNKNSGRITLVFNLIRKT
jgi:uncharacterized protein (TIGR02466 family)